jgi:N-acyl-D-amino-acid deacylase
MIRIFIFFMIFMSFLSQPLLAIASSTSHHSHSIHHSKKKSSKKSKKKLSKKKNRVTPIISSDDFDKQYTRFLRRWEIPGSSVAIIKNDKWIVSKGYGWADVLNQRPMTPDSVFRIASVSKAITAVAILQLVQEGKLSLNTKVYDILNDLTPLSNAMPARRVDDITLRNLLEMSSGWITDRGIDPMLGPWSTRMLYQLNNRIPPACDTASRMMMTTPLQYAPGTQFSYSNINYCMLGLIVNKVTHQQGYTGYENYVKQRLLSPFGITSMRIGDSTPGKQVENEVHYYFYEPKNSKYTNTDRLNDGLPYGQTQLLQKNFSDGGWLASAPDLARFVQALNHYAILTPNMIKIMMERPSFQENPNHYFAKGWNVKYVNDHRYLLKTGSFTGTQALVMLEDNGTVYVTLFNAKPSNRKIFLAQLQNILTSYSHRVEV